MNKIQITLKSYNKPQSVCRLSVCNVCEPYSGD